MVLLLKLFPIGCIVLMSVVSTASGSIEKKVTESIVFCTFIHANSMIYDSTSLVPRL